MKKLLDRVPILAYILTAFVKAFLIGAAVAALSFGILWMTGIYARLETALDLKYNSPVVLIPMWAFVALFVLCFFIGFLMYFYKYKRANTKTTFYKALAPVLDETGKSGGGR